MLQKFSKKHIFTLAAAAALVCAVAALCVAFNVSRVQASNVLTFGSVKMCVSEYELDAQGSEIAFDPATETQASSGEISRIVRMQNVGEQPMYVRARLRMVWVGADGCQGDAPGNVVFNVECDGADAPWVRGDDGWYYYRAGSNGVVAPGESTENLLDSLRFVGDYHDAAHGGGFQLKVDAQAVQAANQQNGDAPMSVMDVRGWPEGGMQ